MINHQQIVDRRKGPRWKKQNDCLLSTITIGNYLVVQNTQTQTQAEATLKSKSAESPAKPGGEGFAGTTKDTRRGSNEFNNRCNQQEKRMNLLRWRNALCNRSNSHIRRRNWLTKTWVTSNTENGDFLRNERRILSHRWSNGNNYKLNRQLHKNGNGVQLRFRTTTNVSDTIITMGIKDNSGGIQTTGGGTMNATNLTVNTAGNSSAAIRTDRGGGNVTVEGTYTSGDTTHQSYTWQPNITVKNATLKRWKLKALAIEGQNSIKY